MKKYKKKLSIEQATIIRDMIIYYLSMSKSRDAITAMHHALLSEVLNDLSQKVSNIFKKEAPISWSMAQAKAMQILFKDYIDFFTNTTDYMYHILLRMSAEIDQMYQ